MYEKFARPRYGAHRIVVVHDSASLLDQSHQVLSVVVSVGLSRDSVKVLSCGSEYRNGVMAYEHHAILKIYPAAHVVLHSFG